MASDLLITLGLNAGAFISSLSSTVARAQREAEAAAARAAAAPRGSAARAAAEAERKAARDRLSQARASTAQAQAAVAAVSAGIGTYKSLSDEIGKVTASLNSGYKAAQNLAQVQYAGGNTKSITGLEGSIAKLREAQAGFKQAEESYQETAAGKLAYSLKQSGFGEAGKGIDAAVGIDNERDVRSDNLQEIAKAERKLFDLKAELARKEANLLRVNRKQALEDEAAQIEELEKTRKNRKGDALAELNAMEIAFAQKVFNMAESQQKKTLTARIQAITSANQDTNLGPQSASQKAKANLARKGKIGQNNPDDPLEEGFEKFTPEERRERNRKARKARQQARILKNFQAQEQKKIDEEQRKTDKEQARAEQDLPKEKRDELADERAKALTAEAQKKKDDEKAAKDKAQDDFARRQARPDLTSKSKAERKKLQQFFDRDNKQYTTFEKAQNQTREDVAASQSSAENWNPTEHGGMSYSEKLRQEMISATTGNTIPLANEQRANSEGKFFAEGVDDTQGRVDAAQQTVNAQFYKPGPAKTEDNNKTNEILGRMETILGKIERPQP